MRLASRTGKVRGKECLRAHRLPHGDACRRALPDHSTLTAPRSSFSPHYQRVPTGTFRTPAIVAVFHRRPRPHLKWPRFWWTASRTAGAAPLAVPPAGARRAPRPTGGFSISDDVKAARTGRRDAIPRRGTWHFFRASDEFRCSCPLDHPRRPADRAAGAPRPAPSTRSRAWRAVARRSRPSGLTPRALSPSSRAADTADIHEHMLIY